MTTPTDIRTYYIKAPVSRQNGLVIQPVQNYGQSKVMRSFWVSCPNDGPQPPVLKEGPEHFPGTRIATRTQPPDRWEKRPAMALCSVCEVDGPLRSATIPIEKSGSHEKCTRRCLEGKITCHCMCRGRCHSEGECYCEVAA
jgi:hypothetical protein